ncbi:MAG: response regulator, partial [Bacteroidota bacterium]
MPSMTGWEFLEKFDAFKEPLKNQFHIYIFSSSIDPRDIQQAKANPLVVDFIEKPLNKKTLLRLFGIELTQGS